MPSSGPSVSGDLKSLAQQVLDNKNITFDYGPSGATGKQFKRLANGLKATTDDGREVDVEPILLVALLTVAQTDKVQVSALTDGSSHTAPGNPHGMGKAMDLDFLNGVGTNGSDSVAYKIIGLLAKALPSGSRFGMGDNPFSGTKTIDGKDFTSFGDNPNHVHFDVVGVSQADDDKAVSDAAAGIISGAGAGGGGASCCPGGGGGGGSVTLTGTTNAEKAFNYFIGAPANLSPQAAAGIVGNMMVESGGRTENLDTHAHNNISGTHDGIVQWSTSRWAALQSHESGGPYDLATQLDYVWYELQHSYPATLNALKHTSSARDAAGIFNDGPPLPAFEASGDESGNRERLAQQIFAKYGGGAAGGGGGVVSGGCSPSTPGPVNIIKHDSFGNADGLMGHQPTMIGLHYTAGNEQTVDELVNDLSDPTGVKGCNRSCSVQLTVDPKGNVYQLTSRLDVITENIINFNDADIGIEIMGLDESALLNNKTQFDAVTALVTQLMQKYHIDMVQDYSHKKGLMGHIECDNWSQAHLGDHFKGIYSGDSPVQSTDSHTDPGATYMSKVRGVVGPAL